MDANQLLFYLRGVFENVTKPNKDVWENVRTEILAAKTVEKTIVPVEVRNPIPTPPHFLAATEQGGCGCDGSDIKGRPDVTPVLQLDKL